MELNEPRKVDGQCVVCEKCNVGKVFMKMPIGSRVTDLSKTPLTKLLSSLLKEVVTEDMMLCAQCLKCLNKKDRLMVLEKEGLSGASKPRGNRGRGKRAPQGGPAAATAPPQRKELSRGSGRGRKCKTSSSDLNPATPKSKVQRSGDLMSVDCKTNSGVQASSTPTDVNDVAVPCITAIKDEVLSDDESQQQTTEICFNSDTVVATTTTPQCPRDPLTLDSEEPFHCDLIKSEITVDGDDCVVGVRCGDGTSGPPATVHVVSSIDGPAPAAACVSPAADLQFADESDCPSPAVASSSLANSFLYASSNAVTSFSNTVAASSYLNISAAASSSSSLSSTASGSFSTSASIALDHSIVLPCVSVASDLHSMEQSSTTFSRENSEVVHLNSEEGSPMEEENEGETIYVDMPDISSYSDEAGMKTDGTGSSHSLIAADDGRLPRVDLGCVAGSVFPCSLCSSSFTTAGALRLHHEQSHNKLKRAQCLSCPFYSSDLAEVEGHMRNEHQIQSQHYCKFCEAEFILKDSHQNHIKVVHKVKNNRYYDKLTPSTVHRKKVITCPHCETPLCTEKDLIRHNKLKHDGAKFPCKYCSFKCNSYKTWTRHDAEKHKKKSKLIHTCTECKREFDSEVELEAHCGNQHNLEKTHRCKLCGDLFITAAMMRYHLTKHNPYTCPICNFGFKKLENYQAHINNIHNNDRPGLTLEEVPGQVNAVLSSQVSDTFEGRNSTAEVVTSPTKVLQLSSDIVQNQSMAAAQEQSFGSDEGARQYDEEIAEDYLKKVRGTPYNQKVPCIFCYKEVTAGHLRTHFKNHSGVTPYSCDFCSKVCIQSTNLRKHVRSKHPEQFQSWDTANTKVSKKKSVACEFCDKLFEGVDECEVHLWEHLSSKDHECSYCKTKFGSENNLKEHMKTHYFEEPRECQFCKGRTFKIIGFYNEHVENCKNQWTCTTCSLCLRSESKFRKHMKTTHSGTDPYKYVCPEPGCDRKFFEKHRYDDHCITHESERRYQCPHCSKKFKRLRPMKEHIRYKHNGARCPSCKMSFTSVDQLVEHRIKSHSSDFRECPECALMFVNDATLANHVRCCHPDDEAFEIPQCHICNELCASEAELSTHFTEHQKGNYICCAFGCYASFPCEEDFRDHLSTVHEDLDYECVYCQADQLSEAALRRHHVDSHGKERTCPVCAAPCYREEHLQRHAAQHGHDSKYLCDACDFTCNNRYWMVSHLKNSHYVSSENLMGCVMKQRVYGCSSCDTLIASVAEITQHILSHEASENTEVLSLALPTKLESDSLSCPVCSIPWPNQSVIIEHLQQSKFCAEQLSLEDRLIQDVDATSTDQLALSSNPEFDAGNGSNTTPSDDVNIVFVDGEKNLFSSILTSDGKSGSATLVEVNGQQYLAPLSDSMLDGSCSKAATVVEVNGEHYVVLRESKDDTPEIEASDQQHDLDSGHAAVENGETLNVLLQPSSVAEEGLSVMLDEEHLSSLFNSSKEVIYPHDM